MATHRTAEESDRNGDLRSVFAPPESSGWGLALTTFVVLALAWAAFDRYPVAIHSQPKPAQPAATPTRSPAISSPSAQPVNTPPAATTRGTVVKCVLGGRVTFTDGPCEAGAQSTRVTLQAPNVVEPVRQVQAQSPGAVAQTQPPAQAEISSAATASVPPDANVALRAECTALEQAVSSIDAQARQPQSASMQDWLAAERKKLRDRQFSLRC